jgi:hypothetical protein
VISQFTREDTVPGLGLHADRTERMQFRNGFVLNIIIPFRGPCDENAHWESLGTMYLRPA